jgi:CelD/BcsL family acetyltransferase involved in cellulose biosynthesis
MRHDAAYSHSVLQRVQVRAVESFTELSANEQRAWNALFEKQADAVPFQSLSWNEAWWTVFGRSSWLATKGAVILILSRRDEIIAFFPMFRVRISVLGIPLLRHIKPMGSDPNLTEIKTGIVREGHEKEAYAALADYFKHVDRRWEIVSLPAVPAGVGTGEMLPVEHPTMPEIEGFILDLAADWETFRGGLKRNIKEAIRKCENSPKRDGVEPVFTCLSDTAAIREMLPEFYQLHGVRAREPNGIQHPDYFEQQEARSLIDLLVNDPVKSGIRLFVLKDGERLVAARLAFETPCGTYVYYSGYDPAYGKYSIMTRLVVEALKRSMARGHKFVHLSFGRDVSKTRWSPREVAYKQYCFIQNSLRGRMLAALYMAILKRRDKRISSQKPSPPQQAPSSVDG